jgi:DNA-binding transcriptional LysR family regulator
MPRSPIAPALDPAGMLVFAALARAGGVRAAASALGAPRSTVSRRLAELEDQAGAPLVVRTSQRFELTDLGRAMAERCEELEMLLRRSRDTVVGASGEPSGILRVAAAPVLGEEILPAVLGELLAGHPRLSVEVRMSVDYVDLRKGDVDVALRAWPLEDASDLFAVRLGTSMTGFWVSPAYAKARGVPATPADLASHDCIIVGSASPAKWTFQSGRREQQVKVTGRVRVDSFRLARDLAARGEGVVRMARILAEPLVASGDLIPVLERHWARTPLHAVHAGPNPPASKVRSFIALARAAVAKRFPGPAEVRTSVQ